MKKQMIEIEVPDGKNAVWKDGKVVFEDIEPQLPNTWEEFCEQNRIKKSECYLDVSSCIREAWDGKRYSYTDKNLLPYKGAAKAHLALMQLHQLRNCYRQGWEPTDDEVSFAIVRRGRGQLGIDRLMFSSRFLSFQSIEIVDKFWHNFRDLIEQAGDLI